MKKLWKALSIAALAAVVPVRLQKDEETGKKTFQSLLWKLDISPAGNGDSTEISLDFMEGVATSALMKAVTAKKEAELFTDDPAEAAVITDGLAQAATDEAQAADEAQEAEDVAQAAADNEAGEADFDPEF